MLSPRLECSGAVPSRCFYIRPFLLFIIKILLWLVMTYVIIALGLHFYITSRQENVAQWTQIPLSFTINPCQGKHDNLICEGEEA